MSAQQRMRAGFMSGPKVRSWLAIPALLFIIALFAGFAFWPAAPAHAVSTASFAPPVNYGAGTAPSSVATEDFNSDGKADLAAANYSSGNVSILMGAGDGTFGTASNYSIGTYPNSVTTGDFNRDGKADLAVGFSSASNNVAILMGVGDGTFVEAVNYSAGSSPKSLTTGDFNKDGKIDLATANLDGNNVSILMGNGDGTFIAAVNYTVGTTPVSVTTGDFDGDNDTDLAVANRESSNVSILIGNGDGTFIAAVNYNAGFNTRSVTTGDFNADGKTDLATANNSDDNVSILMGNGNGTFIAAVNYSVGTSPQSVVTGDFNRDSKIDLASANWAGDNVSILMGKGDGTFVAAVNYGAGTSPDFVIAGDFNKDGKTDLAVANSAGNNVSVLINSAKDYYWTWYDDAGGDNWVLLANPASATGSLGFELAIGGTPMDLSGYNNGIVPPGQSITPRCGGVMGGPVEATLTTEGSGIASQRILWPNGGSSLEEVLGTGAAKLSDHVFWTWYDEVSAGYRNWVLVANPSSTAALHYEIKIAGDLKTAGGLAPGARVTPEFGGVMGGPVEVQAWTDASKAVPANVMASQRVLSGGGAAFNEVPGIAIGELSDRYLWTWYDMVSPGASDWVLITNPGVDHTGAPQAAVTATIKVAGTTVWAGGITPGASVTPTFPGVMGGPVEVTATGDVIASQRSLWGPSFEEVAGYPAAAALPATYHWTWYDQQSAGMTNWILISNQAGSGVTYTIKVAGATVASGSIPTGGSVTPVFNGVMGGPVEVQASGSIMASQRVLYNGFFNEVLGTTLAY